MSTEADPAEPGDKPPAGPRRALVLVPVLRGPKSRQDEIARSTEARVEEAAGLARAINLDVADAFALPIGERRSATLLGSGKVAEIGGRVAAAGVGLVIIDHAVTPIQQRNLEKAWNTKVIDRTGLILEIFGDRAQTREGRLQVELAHLTYQKGRLVRSWTHLERQRGGFGFLGGPGETQIEADRRLIETRITRIEQELAGVVHMRRIQRANRKRSGHPVVALVGYTNAGKSTLFNALTRAEQRAEDLLFATLDPTLRRITLPHGSEVIISDTVGFISNLPTHLVAAFRATLEEVTDADLILHVRDIANPDTEAQAADVAKVLGQLGVEARSQKRIIEVWNKIDLLPAPPMPAAGEAGVQGPRVVRVSAMTGAGIGELRLAIEEHLHLSRETYRVHLAGAGLARLHSLYALGEVMDRTDLADGSTEARVRVDEQTLPAFRRVFPEAVLDSAGRRAAGRH